MHRRRRTHLPGALAISSLFGCDPAPISDDEAPIEAIELVDPSLWSATPAESDPIIEHRPAVVDCPTAAYGLEFGVLEVDTGQCNYLSVSQPLTRAIARGDSLRVTVWWQTSSAVEPAEGHVALFVDDELLWETHVAIPGKAEARQIDFISPFAAEPGATLTFHLHNHGYNSWTLGGLEYLEAK